MLIKTNGIGSDYRESGSGVPVIFIHAFPLNQTMWDEQRAALQSDCRVITLDLRGFGQSDAPPGPSLMDQMAADVRGVMSGLNIERAVLVGLSMGGGHALQIGFGHLELFSAVAAFSSAVPGNFESRFKPLLDDPNGTNKKLKQLWIGCGRQDQAFERNQKLSELLTARKVRNTFYPTEGLHNFAIWRRYLVAVVPLLFRESGKPQ
jgi:pimeloyl-ACP methyl ester carboxylesterase